MPRRTRPTPRTLRKWRHVIDVLYEDDGVLVVDKPPGIDAGGASGVADEGLAEWLTRLEKLDAPLQPINRLSRYESGILLLARDAAAGQALRAALKKGSVRQVFVAVVEGRLSHARETLGGRRRPAPKPARKKTRPPRGDARATEMVRLHPGKRRTIVECQAWVENTHALRAQLRGHGLRVLGDSLHRSTTRRKRDAQTCLHLVEMPVARPGRKRPLVIRSEPPAGFLDLAEGRRDLYRPLHAALCRRLFNIEDRDTDCVRLLHGPSEDLAGLVIERFGPVLILQVHDAQMADRRLLRDIARWYHDRFPIRVTYAKPFMRNKPVDMLWTDKPLLGRAAAGRVEVRESGLKFAIDPAEPTAVGLYLGHRINRQRVRTLAKDRRVLNMFAYTCGFSVAAAAGGATEVVSVDMSRRHLDWGRDNIEANGLDGDRHRFITEEALAWIGRAGRRGDRFDMIILDPPTFAHARRRGKDFSIARDLGRLVAGAIALLEPGGLLMVSTNYRQMTYGALRRHVRAGAGSAKIRFLEKIPLPPDFATDPDHSKAVIAELH